MPAHKKQGSVHHSVHYSVPIRSPHLALHYSGPIRSPYVAVLFTNKKTAPADRVCGTTLPNSVHELLSHPKTGSDPKHRHTRRLKGTSPPYIHKYHTFLWFGYKTILNLMVHHMLLFLRHMTP